MKRYCNHSKGITIVIADMGGGGAQKVVSLLTNYWIESGININLITFSNPDSDYFELNKNINRINLDLIKKSRNLIEAVSGNIFRILKLRKAIKNDENTVVISFILSTNILTILATRFLCKKVIISERNNPEKQTGGFFWGRARKHIYSYADIVTANSIRAIDVLSNYVNKDKLVLIENPVQNKNKQSNQTRKKIILTVARLHPQKGLDVLIKAFSKITKLNPNYYLYIIGEGSQKEFLVKYADELNMTKKVKFLGMVKDVSYYYQISEIFCLPSRYEGTSNAMLEAMSFGLPVVLSDAARNTGRDKLDGIVHYFKNEDSEELFEKLNMLINSNNEAKVKIQKKSVEYIQNNHSIDAISNSWLSLVYS